MDKSKVNSNAASDLVDCWKDGLRRLVFLSGVLGFADIQNGYANIQNGFAVSL